MAQFEVSTSIEIPTRQTPRGGVEIDRVSARKLGDRFPKLQKPGCYVFAIRSGRGSLPIYVGMTTRDFIAEALNDRNITLLNEALNQRRRGKLDLYVVTEKSGRRGPPNKSIIPAVESYLILQAYKRNKELINMNGKKSPTWSIEGVYQSSARKNEKEKVFSTMMGLDL